MQEDYFVDWEECTGKQRIIEEGWNIWGRIDKILRNSIIAENW